MGFYPAANLPGGTAGVNNYLSNAPTTDDFINFLGRLDYNMSLKSRLNFDIRRTDYTQTKNNYFNNAAEGSSLYRQNWGGTLDEVYTLTPHSVLDARFNFTRLNEGHGQPGTGYDPGKLGFPSYLAANSNYLQLPIASLSTFQPIAASGANKLPSQSSQLFGSVVNIMGAHTLKIGGDARLYRLNVIQYGNSAGTFAFGNTYVRASSSASGTVAQRKDLASLLLGLPTGGSYDVNTSSSLYQYYGAVFVQDDWRISRTLTVNLGLRFDHESPYTEKYGRAVTGFDTTSANPLAAAIAAYAKNPNPLLPASDLPVRQRQRLSVQPRQRQRQPTLRLCLEPSGSEVQDRHSGRLCDIRLANRDFEPRHYGCVFDESDHQSAGLQRDDDVQAFRVRW